MQTLSLYDYTMRYLILIFGIWISGFTFACDICSSFFEIIPNDRKSSIGFNYTTLYRNGYPTVHTKHAGHLNLIGSEVKEIFDTYELRGRYAFTDRFFGEMSIPIRNIYQGVNKSARFDYWGLGDIQLQVTYRPISKLNDKGWNNRLDITGGFDLPSGKWLDSTDYILIDPIYQMGSGSFDFWGGLSYVVRYNYIGVSLQGMYRYNTKNPLHYRFGSMATADFAFFGLIKAGDFMLMPRAGLFYEWGEKSEIKGLWDEFSGGSILSLQWGLSVNYKQYQFNAFLRNTAMQISNGPEARQHYVAQFGLVYAFKGKKKTEESTL